ncbi:MAG: hypothetical protein Q9168_004380 [Polycauliona sp. 1 TL-2023]
MLGRLQMTTQDALQTYNKLAELVFGKNDWTGSFQDGAFNTTTLEKAFQSLVAQKGLGESMSYETNQKEVARCFVCAGPAGSIASPRLFRSYTVPDFTNTNDRIWEAARMTTAAPTIFEQMTIVGNKSGGENILLERELRINNPAPLVLDEALKIFGKAASFGCLISIGTGDPDTIGLAQPIAFQKFAPTGIIGALKRTATVCEKTSHKLEKRFKYSPDRYFGYSVTHSVGSVSLEEWKIIDKVQIHTKAYMNEAVVSSSIDKVVSILCRHDKGLQPEPSLQSICQS